MSTIELKSKADIERLRRANMIVFEVLQRLTEEVKPGVSTWDLNAIASDITKARGAKSAFLNYPAHAEGVPPFSGVICASVNDQIVHGIPNKTPLSEGDIVSIDYGCFFDDFCGDSAVTVGVGKISAEAQKLLDTTRLSLEDAIKQCRPGNRIGDISHAVQSRCEAAGLGVVREFVGHGIGRKMHEPPAIPNFGKPGQGRILKAGMVLAIEPMITCGGYETRVLEDGWTAVTKDGSLSAHFEHSVAITDGEPIVLSRGR